MIIDYKQLNESMMSCLQFKNQSVFEHGVDVNDRFNRLKNYILDNKVLLSDWKLPSWINESIVFDAAKSCDDFIITYYQIYHDCGKPLCLEIDEFGRQHFPCHADVSKKRWLECSDGSEDALKVAELIGMDMDAHLLRASGVSEFASRPQAAILLLTALCEIHSNAEMFGGINSVGFKIKFKHLEKFGKRIITAIKNVI